MSQQKATYHNNNPFHGVDWIVVACYVILAVIGMMSIYSSEYSADGVGFFTSGSRAGKQLLWIGISIVVDILILFIISPHLWEVLSTPAYFVMLLLLIAVIFLGVDIKGSHSWFAFGPVRFQPAEVSKITTSLCLATLLSQPEFKLSKPRDFAIVAAAIALPMLIIIGESETGTTLVYLGFLFVLYRHGLSGWFLAGLGLIIVIFIVTLKQSPFVALILAAVASIAYFFLIRRGVSRARRNVPYFTSAIVFVVSAAMAFSTEFIFQNILQPHQRKRIEVLIGLKEDPSGVGYNVHQSMIAIGSGGFNGKGYLEGTQTTYGFVPEQSTDFIFCNVGEEWGFIGCFLLISIFAVLIWRLMYSAEKSTYKFTRIYGYCVASCLFMHLVINIGMTIGLMPVIGIPLPLVSYGGSSMLAFSVMIFIYLALLRNERKFE